MEQQNFNNYIPQSSTGISPFPVLAKVISHLDPTNMGILQVQILRDVGSDPVQGQTFPVQMISPFWGQTSVEKNNDNEGYNSTQKSYGMWMVPPDVGTLGVVIFINGNPKRGYWMGFVPDDYANFMVPGLAATEFSEDKAVRSDTGELERVPVAEYNKLRYKAGNARTPTEALKPKHPLRDVFSNQGLLYDDIRGITSSSARRDLPSMVFGISSPGPLDRGQDAPSAQVGVTGNQGEQFISRLGGTTFVMDDGDSAFLRKGSASGTPPEYAAIEHDDSIPSNPNIPHNELFRIRTRTGHQILLHNSEDLIYIGNAKGTAWVELTSNGKIDIYAEDSISIHSAADLNIRADRDINLEAGRNFNINVEGSKSEMIKGNANIIVYKDNKITTAGNLNCATIGATRITSNGRLDLSASAIVGTAGRIYWNSNTSAVAATAATPLTTHNIPDENGKVAFTSILKRVPMHEPWPHHENLNPALFTEAKTDRDTADAIPIPDAFKKYTTSVDTFRRDPPSAAPSSTFTI